LVSISASAWPDIFRQSVAGVIIRAEFFSFRKSTMTDLELLARVFLSLAFGLIVGVERQWHHKNAGIKTNTLVAVGSTAFALISERGFGPTNNPAAVAAGVVTGIGFIGAGVILRRGGSVQGINSAATLWATASMGLAIGQGFYKLAPVILGAVLIVQLPLRWITSFIDKRSGLVSPLVTYHLSVSFAPSTGDAIRSAWSSFASRRGVSVISYSETQSGDSQALIETSFGLSDQRSRELTALGHNVASLPGVTRAHWSSDTTTGQDDG
jgi:putative Mg2+ transporter-C (MgtC) family protein